MARKTIATPTTLRDKVAALATLQGALRAETQRAEVGEALARTRLGDALIEALAARAEAEARAEAAIAARWRAGLAVHPDRRNRLRALAERALARLGPPGQALVLARSGVAGTSLFDADHYRSTYPDVRSGGLVHYLLSGGAEGRSPHPLFDGGFYRRRNAEALARTGLSPLVHYLRIGAAEGLDPHPLFDTAWYLSQVPDLVGGPEAPIDHYLRVGAAANLSPHRLFRPAYYRDQLPPAERTADPLLHYLAGGWRRGLKPHPLFDPAWYIERHPDAAGFEPLSHFAEHAIDQFQDPGPWFASQHYATTRGAAHSRRLDPLSDYLAGGAWSAAEPSPGFHPSAYLAAHPELASGAITPLEHWAGRAG